jgi:hypothetical protein
LFLSAGIRVGARQANEDIVGIGATGSAAASTTAIINYATNYVSFRIETADIFSSLTGLVSQYEIPGFTWWSRRSLIALLPWKARYSVINGCGRIVGAIYGRDTRFLNSRARCTVNSVVALRSRCAVLTISPR